MRACSIYPIKVLSMFYMSGSSLASSFARSLIVVWVLSAPFEADTICASMTLTAFLRGSLTMICWLEGVSHSLAFV